MIPTRCAEPFSGLNLTQACPFSQLLLFTAILDNFINQSDDITRLCQRVIPKDTPDQSYDFIVVGGGTAGSVVASRLSEVLNWKVLLLEAGPDEPPGAAIPSMLTTYLGSDFDWRYRTTNEPHACRSTNRSCSWPRGKSLGGTSVHNGMMYIRGFPSDFDQWAALGNTGWSWKEVLPYFMHSENNGDINKVGRKYHATGGLLNIEQFRWQPNITKDLLNAAQELGYGLAEDFNGDRRFGFSLAQFTTQDGMRVSSAKAFLQPARDRPNLDIVINATVSKIIVENNKAVGVQYFKNGEFHVVKAVQEVVLSAGTINSPQILMLSGIGPRSHLKSVKVPIVRNLPGVGYNLFNHVPLNLVWSINIPEDTLDWNTVTEYLKSRRGPMASIGITQLTGFVSSKYSTPDHPDLQILFGGFRPSCEVNDQPNPNNGSLGIYPSVLRPRSSGRVRLRNNNPLTAPIMTGNYFTDPRDVDVLIEGIKIALSLANSKSMKHYSPILRDHPLRQCAQHTFMTDEYWKCAISYCIIFDNHQSGTCKMGPSSDPMAVVDPMLRVHGIKGLRVGDLSIMPKITSGNTAAPAYMIGERVAAFIKEERGLNPFYSSW